MTPEYGTVEHYAAMLREHARTDEHVYVCTVGVVEHLAGTKRLSDADKVRLIRNAVEAVAVVRAELRVAQGHESPVSQES